MVWGLVGITIVVYSMLMKYIIKGLNPNIVKQD